MKKLLIVIMIMALTVGLFAEFKPFGSVRLWYGYTMLPELTEEDNGVYQRERLKDVFALQSNSRFGMDWKDENFTAKAEFGYSTNGYTSGGSLTTRLLWAKQDFGSFSLLVGQDYDGAFMVTNQAGEIDLGLIGYGAIDSGRNPQIKFEMKNGFYAALIKPEKRVLDYNIAEYEQTNLSFSGRLFYAADSVYAYTPVPQNDQRYGSLALGPDNQNYDFLFPKVNLGYKLDLMDKTLKIHPSLMFQMYNTNPDFISDNLKLDDYDFTVTSFLFATEIKYEFEKKLRFGLQFHVGQNIGNMGINAAGNVVSHNRTNYALLGLKNNQFIRTTKDIKDPLDPDGDPIGTEYQWALDRELEVFDTMSLGGTFTVGFDVNQWFLPSLGFGFAQDSNELWRNVQKQDYKLEYREEDLGNTDLNGDPVLDKVELTKVETNFTYSDEWTNTRMAFYVQPKMKFGNLQIIPEVGMLLDGKISQANIYKGKYSGGWKCFDDDPDDFYFEYGLLNDDVKKDENGDPVPPVWEPTQWKVRDLDKIIYFGLQLQYSF